MSLRCSFSQFGAISDHKQWRLFSSLLVSQFRYKSVNHLSSSRGLYQFHSLRHCWIQRHSSPFPSSLGLIIPQVWEKPQEMNYCCAPFRFIPSYMQSLFLHPVALHRTLAVYFYSFPTTQSKITTMVHSIIVLRGRIWCFNDWTSGDLKWGTKICYGQLVDRGGEVWE